MVRYVGKKTIDLGEAVYIKCKVKPLCGIDLPFEITSATYELYKGEDGELADSGDCDIDGHIISAFINPDSTGFYTLRYTYEVAEETWVDNIRIKVV